MDNNIYTTAFEFIKRENEPDSIEKGIAILSREVELRPDDSKAWFELAGGYDFLGREQEALPHYEKALALGVDKLPEEDRPRIFVQLGSTLRNLKKYDDAKNVLQQGIARYPEVAALKAFLALTEYSNGNYRTAAKIFLGASLHGVKDKSLQDYSRALKHYLDQIDTFPARQRNWMRIYTAVSSEPKATHTAVLIQDDHIPALAHLMDIAYQGTIDHEGETLEQCAAEMRGTIEGKYGPFIREASSVSFDGANATSASLITLYKGLPLIAFSMTAPDYQGRGLAGFLIRKSAAALREAGFKELYLVVTEGNTPAEKLYRKLGFDFLGPAIPGRGFVEGNK